MFTGIIENTGKVIEKRRGRLIVSPHKEMEPPFKGESFSIDGVCLTAVKDEIPLFFELSPLTEERTTLGLLKKGSVVNIERALKAGERMGGHFVQGHVDGVGTIVEWQRLKVGFLLSVRFPAQLSGYIVEKGSIAVDGISLTIQRKRDYVFQCAVLPFTYENTGLKTKKAGSKVNLEVDILAKYVAEMSGMWKDREEKIRRFLEEK